MPKRMGRFAFLWDVIRRNPVTAILAIVEAAIGLADLIKSEFLPERYQHLRVVDYIPTLSKSVWVALVSVLAFVAVWLGSFQKNEEADTRIAALESPLPVLTIVIHELFVIPAELSDVFVRVSVTNDSRVDTIISEYRLSVETDAGVYAFDRIDHTSDYDLLVMDFSKPNLKRLKAQSQLEGFSMQISRHMPLKYGLPVLGWLHFRVEDGTDLPTLVTESINRAVLYMADSCTGSPMHAVEKVRPVDNPTTVIVRERFYL
jgi:hypothetical protein